MPDISNEHYKWWEDEKNQIKIDFPISLTSGEHRGVMYFVATTNEHTKKYLGELCQGAGQGNTKEEAINELFSSLRVLHQFNMDRMLNYERWVPFRIGNWLHIGGTWFAIYGFKFYFRYGSGMKGGRYIPFTKLNISITNLWIVYKKWKRKNLINNNARTN